MTLYFLLICVIAIERLAELIVSNRNREWSRGQGGREFGAGHYPTMVVLHVEPDIWGYIEQRSTGDDASTVPARVAATGLPEPPSRERAAPRCLAGRLYRRQNNS